MNELVIKTQDDLINFANDYVNKNNIITSKNYNLTSAMVGMYNNVLTIKNKDGKSALETCTPISIQNAIYTCIQKELTPTKNQAYFIPYGNELRESDSYFGLIKMVRDYCGANVFGDVILKDDSVRVENRIDGTKVIYHSTSAENILSDKPIIGAYAVATDIKTGRVIDSDMMSIKDIRISLSKSKTGGAVHKDFLNRMARKVPIRRLCTFLLNSSDDTKFSSFDENLNDDNFVDVSYTINTDEQIEKEKEKYEPKEEDKITLDNLKLDSINLNFNDSIPENAVEIDYSEVKGGKNKDKWKVVPNTFNKDKYTCMAIPVNQGGE